MLRRTTGEFAVEQGEPLTMAREGASACDEIALQADAPPPGADEPVEGAAGDELPPHAAASSAVDATRRVWRVFMGRTASMQVPCAF
jgi:hypothetical protein